ncbi:protein kinase (cAMP-dependent, catalytic) inhibitor beta [Chelydra serpentina]|uniref:Protein kinase (cAMP-dependent, catalytic) inhibitor beta n=1 Tax=Chelydra serpentina TaxID=8475 RepID=A0A8T1SVD7_CHESE|nr:protein kinase (cAMP-dependent, catalytic) inhibitor beta [Chelydra serpentina]
MTEVEPVLDFASSGRTGRRNALPDILGSPAGVSPSDLPLKLAEMSLSSGMYQTAGLALPDGPRPAWCPPGNLGHWSQRAGVPCRRVTLPRSMG